MPIFRIPFEVTGVVVTVASNEQEARNRVLNGQFLHPDCRSYTVSPGKAEQVDGDVKKADNVVFQPDNVKNKVKG